VPLIVNWPGTTPAGRVSSSLVDFSDMLPTIAAVAGIEVPADWKIDGISFASEIKGGTPSSRESIYCWYQSDGKRNSASQHVRDRDYKLYADGKFFHVPNDFNESKPIDPATLEGAARATYQRLKTELDKRVKETAAADPKIIELRKRYPDRRL
jgi:arylsulfatase A